MKTALLVSCACVALAVAIGCSRSRPSAAERAPGAAPREPGPSAPGPPATELPRSLRSDVTTMDAANALRALDDATKLLDDTLSAGAPDCGTAKLLRDRICELSERLCRLSAEAPGSELTARCEDGKARCERARTRVAVPCGRI